MVRHIWLHCKLCNKVVKISPEPECEHYGKGLPSTGRSAAPLTTYFEGPDGSINIPPKDGARMPARLRKLGYQEKTIQDSRQYSQFCKRMDAEARKKHSRVMEARERMFEERQKQAREDMRATIRSDYGKEFLDAAIRASEEGYGERYDAGSHIEAFEYDGKQ